MTGTKQEIEAAEPIQGLSEAEAAARRARGENNAAPTQSSRSYRRIFLQNAVTPINLTLFGICIGLAVLGLLGDAGMTGSLVVANVVVGVFQEARAKRKLDAISLLNRPSATVIREGAERVVQPEDIVLGDMLVLKPGDQVLVDGQVVSESALMVDESLLTGESDLVRKRAGDWVSSGSFCMAGSGSYTAERVGAEALANQLTVQARKFRSKETPLQREVGIVLRVMAVLAIALAVQVLNAYRGSAHGMSVSESLRAAAVLASLVPQGLSFMVTTTYAMAVVRMAGSGALIQRINAVESTSNVNLLCLDKTGTLTTNELKLEAVHPIGREPETIEQLLGEYCASTSAGNRTTAAILAECPGEKRLVRDEVPFSSERKWSALSFGEGTYVLGAPEVLQPNLAAGSALASQWADEAASGLRVILFAAAPAKAALHDRDEPVLPADLAPLALVSLRDELRPEAQNTIRQFERAGIRIKIISGDNPETVAALARQAGFAGDLRTISGPELEEMSDSELKRAAERTTVFGRITPHQKERLVRSLRGGGRYVAMIGDGVNDVLAMKQSNLAIAMRSGSQVTRGVADIVLLDDSFGTLPKTFLEGQRIRRGMLDIIRLFLVRTLSVALVIMATTLVTSQFPTTPRQNGVLAFVTVGIPTLALAAWARPGKTPRHLVLSSGHFVIPAALSIAAVSFATYEFFLGVTGGDVVYARSALTTEAIICGLMLIPYAQPPTKWFVAGAPLNGTWRPTLLAGALLGLYVAILSTRILRDFYELKVLSPWSYMLIALVAVTWALGVRYFWLMDLPGRTGRLWRWLTA